MRAIFSFFFLAILISGCSPSTPATVDTDPPKESSTPVVADNNASSSTVDDNSTPGTLAERIKSEAENGFEKLTQEYDAAREKWSNSRPQFKSREEFDAWNDASPAAAYAEKFSELAAKFPETSTAVRCIDFVIERLDGPAKASAIKNRLAAAEMNPDSENSAKIFQQVMKFAKGDSKFKAMEHLLTKAEKNIESTESIGLLTQLIKTPEDSAPKNKAVASLMTLIDKNIDSEKSVQLLSMITANGNDKAKAKAMDKLIAHHIEHDEMLNVIKSFNRQMPNAYVENSLKKICENAKGNVKHHAVVGYAKFLSMRDMFRSSFENASEEDLEAMDPELVAYMKIAPDEKEQAKLEQMLETYVNNNETLIKEAKQRLFAMQNIGIGKVAPEIEGVDLDGQEFKLSDYRGKVVLIDFWGDW